MGSSHSSSETNPTRGHDNDESPLYAGVSIAGQNPAETNDQDERQQRSSINPPRVPRRRRSDLLFRGSSSSLMSGMGGNGNDFLHQETGGRFFWDDQVDDLETPQAFSRSERLFFDDSLSNRPTMDSFSSLPSTTTPQSASSSSRQVSEAASRSFFSLDHNNVMSLMFNHKRQRHPEDVLIEDEPVEAESNMIPDFIPQPSQNHEWMGRSVETLLLGHSAPCPVLAVEEGSGGDGSADDDTNTICDDDDQNSFYTDVSFLEGVNSHRGSLEFSHRNSLDFFNRRPSDYGSGSRRGSLTGFSHRPMHGGTLANYYNNQARFNLRRRSTGSVTSTNTLAGPNIVFSLMARETTGKSNISQSMSHSARLRKMGGRTLHEAMDKPSGGMLSEITLLDEALERGDWTETQTIVSRLAPRLIGDPALVARASQSPNPSVDDPSLPPNVSQYHAGGGRLGFERDTFVLGGGVELLLKVFREPSFVGEELGQNNDARDLSPPLVANKLSMCWNEVLASLRELVYALPILVENGTILEDGEFLPFLFSLLAHDSCFDGAASLIEEILSIQSHSPPAYAGDSESPIDGQYRAMGHVTPVTTFFLGNVPDLYELWQGFSCRQLAHFCRILALLVFEPEDRQLLESPAVLKSLELLQLRRDRAARAGRDATVDMNQAILMGDRVLMERLLKLLRVMNFAPTLRRSSAYHVMAHFPFIAETLVMLGLSEMDDWDDINRLEQLARKVENSNDGAPQSLSELGSVADMLESLSGMLLSNPLEPATQLGHIIHVINAAQQAGVVVGRQRSGRRRRSNQDQGSNQSPTVHVTAIPVESAPSLDNLASAAMTLTDQVMMRRAILSNPLPETEPQASVQVVGIGVQGGGPNGEPTVHHLHTASTVRVRISTPEDAANELQFNALALAPYQVEVLFVLCTLLGGRRKIDAQRFLKENGLIQILDEMFHRLSWGSPSAPAARRPSGSSIGGDSGDGSMAGSVSANMSVRSSDPAESMGQQEVPNGIHGPGCECTPESALSVQYLRLLHNFCDRDCDNYGGRRLLLSQMERDYVFSERNWLDLPDERPPLQTGLFTKVVAAFMNETDDSPYRFWLASCAESYLRGSSAHEQLFAAKSGLLPHLVEDIISDRLHCAGSLQTSFDLLGELCKGNSEVLHLLVSTLNEESFRKLMSAAAANLVDSNVFLRSLLLSVERISAARLFRSGQEIDPPANPWKDHTHGPWTGESGISTRFYLTHSWWDATASSMNSWEELNRRFRLMSEKERTCDEARSSDWFPPNYRLQRESALGNASANSTSTPFDASIGYNGWLFSPSTVQLPAEPGDPFAWAMGDATFSPNTIERLTWFLITNQTRLLRDLLAVVDLKNINHENICCLNTAVVVAIFASRRLQLPGVLRELKRMSEEDRDASSRRKREFQKIRREAKPPDVMQAMTFLDIEEATGRLFRPGSLRRLPSGLGEGSDVLKNFRELLWFWSEYYTHRGRDRLSLEFSSHLRFREWFKVVSMLAADNSSTTSLVRRPVRLPKSPYHRTPRIADNPRGGH